MPGSIARISGLVDSHRAHGLLATVDVSVYFNLFGYSSPCSGWGTVEVGIGHFLVFPFF